MERSTILLVAAALIAMVAIGAAAGSLDAAVEHDAGDLFDSPIAPYEDALAEEVDARAGSNGDDDDDTDATATGSGSPEDGSTATGAAEAAEPVVTDGDDRPGLDVSWPFTLVSPHVALVLTLLAGVTALAVRYRNRIGSLGSGPVGDLHDEAADPRRAIGPAEPSNPVSAMWVDFARTIDPDEPGVLTTTEIAEAAIAAGMDEEAVRELTRLFEEVEYGGQPATADRIRRARSARDRLAGGMAR